MGRKNDKIVELVEVSKALNDYLQNPKKKEYVREWVFYFSRLYNHFSSSLAHIYHNYRRGNILYQNDLRYLINHFLVGYRMLCSMKPSFVDLLYKLFMERVSLSSLGSYSYNFLSDIQFLYSHLYKKDPRGEDYRSMIEKILIALPYDYVPEDILNKYKDLRDHYNFIMFYTSTSLIGILFSLIMQNAILNNRTLDLMYVIEKYRNDRDKQFSWLSREIVEIYLSGRMFSTRSAYISVESFVGHGKTTYSLSSLDIFLSLIGFKNEIGLQDEDLDLFRINDLETFHQILKISYKKNIRFPILILDDSSDWLTPYWSWSRKRSMYEEVRDLLIYGRANVGVYIIVSNGPEDLSSFVRRLIEKRLTAIFFDVPETFVKASGFMLLSRDVRKSVDQFKHIEDIVDAFVYPLMKMPQKIYEEDMAHKREMIKRSVKRISALKRSMVKS